MYDFCLGYILQNNQKVWEKHMDILKSLDYSWIDYPRI